MAEKADWKQTLEEYVSALAALTEMIELEQEGALSVKDRASKFKFFELAELVGIQLMREYLLYKGFAKPSDNLSPKKVINLASKKGVIADKEAWVGIREARNRGAHNYGEEVATELDFAITEKFYPAMCATKEEFESYAKQDD